MSRLPGRRKVSRSPAPGIISRNAWRRPSAVDRSSGFAEPAGLVHGDGSGPRRRLRSGRRCERSSEPAWPAGGPWQCWAQWRLPVPGVFACGPCLGCRTLGGGAAFAGVGPLCLPASGVARFGGRERRALPPGSRRSGFCRRLASAVSCSGRTLAVIGAVGFAFGRGVRLARLGGSRRCLVCLFGVLCRPGFGGDGSGLGAGCALLFAGYGGRHRLRRGAASGLRLSWRSDSGIESNSSPGVGVPRRFLVRGALLAPRILLFLACASKRGTGRELLVEVGLWACVWSSHKGSWSSRAHTLIGAFIELQGTYDHRFRTSSIISGSTLGTSGLPRHGSSRMPKYEMNSSMASLVRVTNHVARATRGIQRQDCSWISSPQPWMR